MSTVLSHIVQKRLSQSGEDVATDALAYILNCSEKARSGIMKLLRGVLPDLPEVQFRTQQVDGKSRYDMRGEDADGCLRVLFENKFWAGLTENQPVTYLKNLARVSRPSMLLFIVPAKREQSVQREIGRRLDGATTPIQAGGMSFCVATKEGPVLAITSWGRVLEALSCDVEDQPAVVNDLAQLRSLCDAADSEIFVPVSPDEVSDQRTPTLLFQLGEVVQSATKKADAEGVISIGKLQPTHSWSGFGRYFYLSPMTNVNGWIGVRFDLWRKHGTPLWITATPKDPKHHFTPDTRPLIEAWAARQGVFTFYEKEELGIAVPLLTGEEKEAVVREIVGFLKKIADVLSEVPSESSTTLSAVVTGRSE